MLNSEDNSFLSKQMSSKKNAGTLTRESITASSPKEQSGISAKNLVIAEHKENPIKRKKSISNNDYDLLGTEKIAQSGTKMISRKNSLGVEDFGSKRESGKEVIVLKKENIQESGAEWNCISNELCSQDIYKRIKDMERRIKELECESLELERKCVEEKMTRIKTLRTCYRDKMEWRKEKVVLLELNKKLGRMIELIYNKIKDIKT